MGDLFFSTPMSDLFAGLEDEEGFEFSLSGKKGGLSDLFGGSPRTAAKKEAPASKPSPAPSSPKQTESRPKRVAAPPSVVYAIAGIVCHKYNQEEKKYDLIGKIGVAILNSSNVFQLLFTEVMKIMLLKFLFLQISNLLYKMNLMLVLRMLEN